MQLNYVKLKGFRRFENATLNTSGKVIALLGPNEAGKSSILQALSYLNDDRPINQYDRMRKHKMTDDHAIIEAAFTFDEKDRTEMLDIFS
jgi:predicted ATP-dependent endonuclease of OLD family